MTKEVNRETFIPYRRTDLIELCLQDGQLGSASARTFRDFCEILSAFYHFKFHAYLERLKDNYAPFDPNAATQELEPQTPEKRAAMLAELTADFRTVLERANYRLLSSDEIDLALEERSEIELNTDVNFDDFDRVLCYARGDFKREVEVKKFAWFKQQCEVEVHDRVVLFLKFKERAYFEEQGIDLETKSFQPGKVYIFLYKDIPHNDLELMFPNIELSMTLQDRLMLLVPAAGAAVSTLLKILPKLIILVGAIAFFAFGATQMFGQEISKQDIYNLMPVLAAILSISMVLGGFSFKQYANYKNKLIEFRKKVVDTLFFRNLANHASVLQATIDAAEEEECKEVILAYYHLLASGTPLTPQELSDRVNTWLRDKLGAKVDFDIDDAVEKMQAIRGDTGEKTDICLLERDESDRCHVLPLEEAKAIVDWLWDNIFLYANPKVAP